MSQRDLYTVYDRMLDGGLATLLRDLSSKHSIEDLTWELRERNITVSTQTVRRWLTRIGETV